MPREHRRPAGHWTRRVRQSPHVIRLIRYPRFAPVIRQPAGRPMMLWTTGYCLTGRTASGTLAGPGTVASTVLPIGSHVTVPSLHYSGTVLDTGAPLDLWAPCAQTYSFTGWRLVYVS